MAFLDTFFRWKKKPFKESGKEVLKAAKGIDAKKEEKHADKVEKGSGRFAHVLISPHLSEQSVVLNEHNQYVFDVRASSTKGDIARAVQDLYGIYPNAVNTLNVSGKKLRFGKTSGHTKKWKKAIVTLPEGKSIDIHKK